MSRFWLFAGCYDDPKEGMLSFQSAHETPEEGASKFWDHPWHWGQLVDSHTGTIIRVVQIPKPAIDKENSENLS